MFLRAYVACTQPPLPLPLRSPARLVAAAAAAAWRCARDTPDRLRHAGLTLSLSSASCAARELFQQGIWVAPPRAPAVCLIFQVCAGRAGLPHRAAPVCPRSASNRTMLLCTDGQEVRDCNIQSLFCSLVVPNRSGLLTLLLAVPH